MPARKPTAPARRLACDEHLDGNLFVLNLSSRISRESGIFMAGPGYSATITIADYGRPRARDAVRHRLRHCRRLLVRTEARPCPPAHGSVHDRVRVSRRHAVPAPRQTEVHRAIAGAACTTPGEAPSGHIASICTLRQCRRGQVINHPAVHRERSTS